MVRPKSNTLQKETIVRGIKIIDIAWTITAYAVMGIATIPLLHKIFGKFDAQKAEQQTSLRLFGEILLQFIAIGILAYVARNVFQLIPWPFEGVYGFEHMKLKEVTNSAIYVSIVVTFHSDLQARVWYLRKRLNL